MKDKDLDANDELQKTSLRELVKQPLMWLLAGCYLVCIVLILFIFVTIWSKVDASTLGSQTFMVRLMQTTLGMLIGVTFAIMGVYAVSIGLMEVSEVEVTTWGRAASAGPGSLLVVCGTVVIGMCLMRDFQIVEQLHTGTDLQNIEPTEDPPDPTPP